MNKVLSLVLVFSIILPLSASAEGEALNLAGKRALVVGKAAAYGAGGGLVIGVASQVFKKKAKNIFLFGSLGLYAGILTGIYVISTSSGPRPYEGPDTYDDYGDFSFRDGLPKASGLVAKSELFEKDSIQMNFVKLEF